MCIVIYIASDVPLPTSAWDDDRPQFHVRELPDLNEPVRKHFTKPLLYRPGSHVGCACGFQYGENNNDEPPPEKRESRQRLADYLTAALQHQSVVELYACWNGDEELEPEHRGRIKPGQLLGDRTFFHERELLIVAESIAEVGGSR